MQTSSLTTRSLKLGVTLACGLLAACAQGLLVGETPSDPPPAVAKLGARDGKGNEYLTWDRPWAFGKVPPELQSAGDVGCMKIDVHLRAVGYHPKAMDLNGRPMQGGGFYCQPGWQSFRSDVVPKVIRQGDEWGWDRPGLFGAIPADQLARAADICRQQNPRFKPIGFHPAPLDQDGKAMAGGGFLCAP